MNLAKANSITYLAAAVSDFYIPSERMAEHKIQSKDTADGIDLHLEPTPRLLGKVKSDWNPQTQLISFKLETDPQILKTKALGAVAKYGVDMVVANILATRRNKVTIFHNDETSFDLEINPETETQVDSISALIVDHIT